MEDVISRIKKLLALGRDKGASESEAATALAKASELMLKHNIDNVDNVVESEIAGGELIKDIGSHKHYMFLAHAVSQLYTCRYMIWKDSGDYRFIGKALNVQACEETFPWVVEQVDELYKQGLETFKSQAGGWLDKRTRTEFRTTFKEACALKVVQRVREILAKQRNQIPQHMALVVIDNTLKQIDEVMEGRGIRKGRAVTVTKGHLGTGAGFAAGEQVQLQAKVR